MKKKGRESTCVGVGWGNHAWEGFSQVGERERERCKERRHQPRGCVHTSLGGCAHPFGLDLRALRIFSSWFRFLVSHKIQNLNHLQKTLEKAPKPNPKGCGCNPRLLPSFPPLFPHLVETLNFVCHLNCGAHL